MTTCVWEALPVNRIVIQALPGWAPGPWFLEKYILERSDKGVNVSNSLKDSCPGDVKDGTNTQVRFATGLR